MKIKVLPSTSEDNPYSQFLITVMAGVYQLERDLIRMRQGEGIDLSKKEGRFNGRLKKYHKNHAGMNYAVKLYKEGGMTVNHICKLQLYSELHYIES
jgi:DNA invertase Pin-like site-specific DNA recombinase